MPDQPSSSMHTIKAGGLTWCLADPSLESLVKADFSSGIRRPWWICQCGNKKVFVKQFREKGVIGAIRNWLSPRGKKEYKLALRLLDLSIPVPQPLGFAKGHMRSFSVQEYLPGADLLTLFNGNAYKVELLRLLVSLLLKLKKGKLRHNDLHLGNIFINNGLACVIDLHKSKVRPAFTFEDELANLSQALFSIYPEMSEQEKVRFYKLYGNESVRLQVEEELARMRARWIFRKKKRAFKKTSILLPSKDGVEIRKRRDEAIGDLVERLTPGQDTQVERYTDHIRKVYNNRAQLRKAWRNFVVLEYMECAIAPQPFYLQKVASQRKGFIAMEDLSKKGDEIAKFLDRTYPRLTGREKNHFLHGFSRFLLLLCKRAIAPDSLKASKIFVLRDGTFRLLNPEDISFEEAGRDKLKAMLVDLNSSIHEIVPIRDRAKVFLQLSKGLSLSREETRKLWESIRHDSA